MEIPYWATFSQDHSRFACASRTSYLVCQTDPFRELYRGETSWLIDMVEVSSSQKDVVVLVLTDPKDHRKHIVQLFNFSAKKQTAETAYDEKVCRVRLQKDCLVVALERKIDVLRATDCAVALSVETPSNMSGLCAANDNKMLAYPGMNDGEVCVRDMRAQQAVRFAAHTSALASLGISLDGKLIVTASVKGTLVRVFTAKGTLLHEFRRGIEQADIYSVCFSSLGHWLLVSSSKGTIHLFSLRGGASYTAEERSSLLGRVKSIMGLAAGKSFGQLHLSKESASIVGFGRDGSNTILVFQLDGCFSKCRFDPIHGGEMADDVVATIINTPDHRLELNPCFV